MSRYRRTSKKSKYYLEPETYDTVLHYARCYRSCLAELAVYDISKAIRYDQPSVQASHNFDPVESAAIRREVLWRKKLNIEAALDKAAPEEILRKYLTMGVCDGKTYFQLQQIGIPCSRVAYSAMRSRFYYELAQMI